MYEIEANKFANEVSANSKFWMYDKTSNAILPLTRMLYHCQSITEPWLIFSVY